MIIRPSLLAVGLCLLSEQLLAQAASPADPDIQRLNKYCQDQYPGKHAWCKYPHDGECMKCGTCEGKGEKYYHPLLKDELCCWKAGEKWNWDREAEVGACCTPDKAFLVDKTAKKGACCPPDGHKYFYDQATKSGSCCPDKSIGYDGQLGVCKDPLESESPIPSTSGAETPIPSTSGSGCPPGCVTANQAPLPNRCAEEICPDIGGDKLGLEYGSCYRLMNPEGKPLSRKHGQNDYVWGGSYGDIYQFQACKSTTDCPKGGELSLTDTFVLKDQLGKDDDSAGKNWWLGTGSHFETSSNADKAVKFSARAWCGNDNACGICLRGNVKGIGAICPAANPGIGFKNNPRYCQPLIVHKVPCITEGGALEKPAVAAK